MLIAWPPGGGVRCACSAWPCSWSTPSWCSGWDHGARGCVGRRPLGAVGAVDEGPEGVGALFLVDRVEAGGGDRRHRREDAPHGVGPAGGAVLVGRLEQRRD